MGTPPPPIGYSFVYYFIVLLHMVHLQLRLFWDGIKVCIYYLDFCTSFNTSYASKKFVYLSLSLPWNMKSPSDTSPNEKDLLDFSPNLGS